MVARPSQVELRYRCREPYCPLDAMRPTPGLAVLSISLLLVLTSCQTFERKSGNNYKSITQAQRFETGRIFESGEKSKTVAAFLDLLESPDASSRLLKVFQESYTDVGKVYALLGLYQVNRNLFDELLPRLNQKKSIPVLWFGVISNETVGQMVAKIRSGELMTAVRWK